MYRFHVRMFAAGDAPTSAAPLPATFDAALACLGRLPQLFIEPDGAFVWRSSPEETPSWQVDGNLVDRGDTLFFAELKGSCPAGAFDRLLDCFSNGGNGFAFEWVERGMLMNEATFRRSAENPAFAEIPRGD